MASGFKELRQEEQWAQLVIEALTKHAGWPALLAGTMKKRGQSRHGLLSCAVDARDCATVRLRIPVATQPLIAPLCAMARRSELVSMHDRVHGARCHIARSRSNVKGSSSRY